MDLNVTERKISDVSSLSGSSAYSDYSNGIKQTLKRICSKCKRQLSKKDNKNDCLKIPDNLKKLNVSKSFTNIILTNKYSKSSPDFNNYQDNQIFKSIITESKSFREVCGTHENVPLVKLDSNYLKPTSTNIYLNDNNKKEELLCSICNQKFLALTSTLSSFSIASLPENNINLCKNVNNASGSGLNLIVNSTSKLEYFSDDQYENEFKQNSNNNDYKVNVKRHRLKSRKLKSAASRVKTRFSKFMNETSLEFRKFKAKSTNNLDQNNNSICLTHSNETNSTITNIQSINLLPNSKSNHNFLLNNNNNKSLNYLNNSKSTSALDDIHNVSSLNNINNQDTNEKNSMKFKAQLL